MLSGPQLHPSLMLTGTPLSLIPQRNFIAVSAANRFKKISSSGALMALGV